VACLRLYSGDQHRDSPVARENRLEPEDVETITVIGGTGATRLLSEPIELKRRPQLSIDGKYSIPFTTAVMMVRGNVTLRDYPDEGLRDPAVLAMADRVGYRADLGTTLPIGGQSALSRPTVEICTREGRVFSCTPDGVPGDPAHPVGWDLLEAKSGTASPLPIGQPVRVASNG
jgi:2-methylcitrate dehydratase PrpD